mgnify:CR=1 FL=1
MGHRDAPVGRRRDGGGDAGDLGEVHPRLGDPGPPAAMVERGTLPGQRRCGAPLAALPDRAAEMGIHSPAIIIVGGVCALAEELCWFQRLPLYGKRILVTRPADRAGTLSEKLRDLGADVVEFPCIRTEAVSPCPAMEAALERLPEYEWLGFTSAAGTCPPPAPP